MGSASSTVASLPHGVTTFQPSASVSVTGITPPVVVSTAFAPALVSSAGHRDEAAVVLGALVAGSSAAAAGASANDGPAGRAHAVTAARHASATEAARRRRIPRVCQGGTPGG